MIEEDLGYVKLALRRVACHWLVARERPCWLRFIWTQIQVHELGFSDMFNVLISQVRRTTSFPLLASLSLSLSLSLTAFFNFLLIMKIIIYKKELKVRGPLNEKR